MNYLRGAVSAISAPYQYYKDINPSTLTGAIDVIVISRPKLVHSDATPDVHVPSPDGERELACSPFHVRFGKFSLLRPYEKKVEFRVNGKKQDYSMKLGEGGEAFFVFETSDKIPKSLQTSPISSPSTSPSFEPQGIAGEQLSDVDPLELDAETRNRRPSSHMRPPPTVIYSTSAPREIGT